MNIHYTGIGCNKNGIHTEREFIDIMDKEFTNKIWRFELQYISKEKHYQLKYYDWILPDDFCFFTISNWLEYSGASYLVESSGITI